MLVPEGAGGDISLFGSMEFVQAAAACTPSNHPVTPKTPYFKPFSDQYPVE